MRQDVPETVDRGQYPDAVTPWEQEGWRDAALSWAERELAAHGLRVTGQRKVRLRPWSVLVRLPVDGHETVWFKANPPAGAFEAGLAAALARWVPEYVLRPLAVDAERGWSLLPDGGELLREALDRDVRGRAGADPRVWEEALRQYAGAQRALVPYAEEIEHLGVPSARTLALPDVFDRVLAEHTALRADGLSRLRALRPRVVDWCAELAAVGVADSLDHSDLHDGQVFAPRAGRFTFFDWGDAAVSHPFCSFLVPARRARERYGPEVLPRLRDAYLEPWTGTGASAAELRRAVTLAWRLAAIGRACSWGRLFPGATATADPTLAAPGTTADPTLATAGIQWLLRLYDDPPL